MLNTKKRLAVQSAVLLCAILVCSCGLALAQDVKYNFAPGTDFAKFKTYKWVTVEKGQHPNQLVNDMIKRSVDSQLVLKGLTKTDSDTANLYVAYQIAVNKETQFDTMGYGGWGGARYGGGMSTTTSSTIQIGMLEVDLYDVANKKLIWNGNATKTLNPSKDPEKNQKNLDKAVAKLLKNYPPPVKK
jgi:hypothetical protein